MNKVGIIIILLLGLLIGGSFYVFLENFEYKEQTIRTGFLGEARNNPLYASRLFLKRMGIPSFTQKSIQGVTGLPDTDTVLVINSRRTTVSTRQINELINWVKSGGHVIALATHNWNYYRDETQNDNDYFDDQDEEDTGQNDPLQKYLGVTTGLKVNYNDLSSAEQTKVDKIEEKNGDFVNDTLFKIRLNNVDKPLSIMNSWFNPIRLNNKNRDQEISDKAEIITLRSDNFMLRQSVGKGLITLVSSLEFIENKHLDQADHAEIFWHLLHAKGKTLNQPSSVWLIHNDKISPLWLSLWQNAWMLIISLTILFCAWIFTKSRRFGPLITKQDENCRSLNEHISSSGNFYWQQGQKAQLLESSRSALTQKLAKSYPNWLHLSQNEQLSLLETKLEIKQESLHKALFTKDVKEAEEFTKTLRLIEHIRKSH